jgi:hypothetical protein
LIPAAPATGASSRGAAPFALPRCAGLLPRGGARAPRPEKKLAARNRPVPRTPLARTRRSLAPRLLPRDSTPHVPAHPWPLAIGRQRRAGGRHEGCSHPSCKR